MYLGKDFVGVLIVVQKNGNLRVISGASVPEFADLSLHGMHVDGRGPGVSYDCVDGRAGKEDLSWGHIQRDLCHATGMEWLGCALSTDLTQIFGAG